MKAAGSSGGLAKPAGNRPLHTGNLRAVGKEFRAAIELNGLGLATQLAACFQEKQDSVLVYFT